MSALGLGGGQRGLEGHGRARHAAQAACRRADRVACPLCSANNAFRHRATIPLSVISSPIEGPLTRLTPLRFSAVHGEPERQLFGGLLQRYHYLGYRGAVGENLKYLVYDRHARPLACMLFGAAAWQVACRERFIGWDRAARERGLALLANNMRFLILPWVRVPHLASHILGPIARRISRDWQAKYAHRLVLLETYVERPRFLGTCYRAASWVCVGETQGRSRNDRRKRLHVPVKSVWLYPLRAQFRARLCHTEPWGRAHRPLPSTPAIPPEEQTPTVKLLRALLSQHRTLNAHQRALEAEVRRLKHLPRAPKIKPSALKKDHDDDPPPEGLATTSKPKRPGSKKRRKQLKIHRTEIVQPDTVPPGARFLGYQDYYLQDLIIEPFNTRYRLARYRTLEGEHLIGQLPEPPQDLHFGHAAQRK